MQVAAGSAAAGGGYTGAKVTGSDVVYAPFGEVRTGTEIGLTDFGYTGQRHDDSTGGLMYYGARYYLPGVLRFISPDTVVPGMFNPQALNRFSYGFNNPVKFIDSNGHQPLECPLGACDHDAAWYQHQLDLFNVTVDFSSVATNKGFNPKTEIKMLENVYQAILAVAAKIETELHTGSIYDAYKKIFEKTTITVYGDKSVVQQQCKETDPNIEACNKGDLSTGPKIYISMQSLLKGVKVDGTDISPAMLLTHELGHTFTNQVVNGVNKPGGFNGKPEIYNFMLAPDAENAARGFNKRASASTSHPEYTADAFMNWVYDNNRPRIQGTINTFWGGEQGVIQKYATNSVHFE